jgi:hypothetical protein
LINLSGRDVIGNLDFLNQTRIKFFDRILTSNPINNISNVWSGECINSSPR